MGVGGERWLELEVWMEVNMVVGGWRFGLGKEDGAFNGIGGGRFEWGLKGGGLSGGWRVEVWLGFAGWRFGW